MAADLNGRSWAAERRAPPFTAPTEPRAQFGASTVAGGAPGRDNGRVRLAPRLAACGFALAALVLVAGGLVFDRIAAANGRFRVWRVVAVPVRPCGRARAGGRRCADRGAAAR